MSDEVAMLTRRNDRDEIFCFHKSQ